MAEVDNTVKTWVEEMIERFRNSTKGISNKSLLLKEEDKLRLVKDIDFEAFRSLFLLVVNGVIDIDITIKRAEIRDSLEYKEWHKQVLKRDNYICQECGSNKHLEAHHIKPLKYFPELAVDLNNGQTLCNNCHRKTDSYGGKVVYKYGREYRKTE